MNMTEQAISHGFFVLNAKLMENALNIIISLNEICFSFFFYTIKILLRIDQENWKDKLTFLFRKVAKLII